MSAPNIVGPSPSIAGSVGGVPSLAATTGEFDATECDKFVLMASGAGLATTETISVYVRNTTTVTMGTAPPGCTPYCAGGAAPAQCTATLPSIVLEGGFLYVFVKSVTAGLCGMDIGIKRAQGA